MCNLEILSFLRSVHHLFKWRYDEYCILIYCFKSLYFYIKFLFRQYIRAFAIVKQVVTSVVCGWMIWGVRMCSKYKVCLENNLWLLSMGGGGIIILVPTKKVDRRWAVASSKIQRTLIEFLYIGKMTDLVRKTPIKLMYVRLYSFYS